MDRFPAHVVKFDGLRPRRQESHEWPTAFVHINKTAGTSFTEYLLSHFDGRPVVAPAFYGYFKPIGIRDSQVELFWGHFTYAQFRAQRRHAWFVTFLRDPIQRVISQYRSLHNPKNLSGDWEKVLPRRARKAMRFAHEATFEEFIFSEDRFILGHLVDLQTAYMSSYRKANNPRYLSSAIDNLQQAFLFFGITERFGDSMDLFRFQLQSRLQYCPAQHHKNASEPYPLEWSPRVASRVEELTACDRVLYSHACELFEERMLVLREHKETDSALFAE